MGSQGWASLLWNTLVDFEFLRLLADFDNLLSSDLCSSRMQSVKTLLQILLTACLWYSVSSFTCIDLKMSMNWRQVINSYLKNKERTKLWKYFPALPHPISLLEPQMPLQNKTSVLKNPAKPNASFPVFGRFLDFISSQKQNKKQSTFLEDLLPLQVTFFGTCDNVVILNFF